MVLSAVIVNTSLGEMAGSFFLLASPLDLVYSIAKSLLFGAAIGVIACYYGLNPPGNSINAVPKAAISAVTQATMAVMLLNILFAYLVYGSALFGLFTAAQ
jgi:phospholipid/cholesterol/gamma-HCH transport system permease protein